MKKIAVGMVAMGLMAFCAAAPVLAANISDVTSSYWATKEINEVVDGNIMSLNNGKFNPEGSVARVDFVQSLLKVLTNDNLNVKVQNTFADVKSSDANYSDILRSQQLGLVYGYPDGTFKPGKLMTRSETQSVISHITKDMDADAKVLNRFSDVEYVPSWSRGSWAKTLNFGIYVNYPKPEELRPNDILSRAEEAVILARLKDKIGLVKDEYKGDKLIGVEHLSYARKAPNNEVKIYSKSNVLQEGNVIAVAFDQKFKSEAAQAGEAVCFAADKNIATDEGTVIFPAGTKFSGKIINVQDPKWFNKNARVYAQIDSATLPDGKTAKLDAKPFYKNYALKEGPWMTTGKLALYTVSGGAVGIGAGVGLAFIPDPTKIGTGIAIGAPVGAAIGLTTGLVTKGLNYHAKDGEVIKVIMIKDAKVSKVQPAL